MVKNMIKQINLLILTMCVLSFTASAAANDSLLNPGMGMSWYGKQSAEFKDLMTWVIGGAVFIVGAAYIILTTFGAGKVQYENTFGSAEGKSHTSNALIKNFGILILMVVCVV